MAMAWTESRFNVNAIGDNGASQGLYQIHLGYHPEITQAQARDIEFSTNWTLNRLIAYGYPVYRSYAVMKHNGTPNTPNTLAYLSRVNNY
jgi:soluble lytic murein transglycosylase-like protein